MINQKPQRVFISRWGLAYLEPFHLDSTFAASESRPFIRDSRRNGRLNGRDDGHRYDVFEITLRHPIVMQAPQTQTSPIRFIFALAAESG
jgi:hypothetical protein